MKPVNQQVRNQLVNQFHRQIINQVHAQVHIQVYAKILDQIHRHQVSNQVWTQIILPSSQR